MAISVTCVDIQNSADKTIARFSVGTQTVDLEIAGDTLADRKQVVFGNAKDVDQTWLCWLALAMFLRRFPNPTQAQINALKTKVISLDLTSNTPLTVA